MKGKKLQLNSDNVLIVEGIHALNPMLTNDIDDNKKFRIYASALTTIIIRRPQLYSYNRQPTY